MRREVEALGVGLWTSVYPYRRHLRHLRITVAVCCYPGSIFLCDLRVSAVNAMPPAFQSAIRIPNSEFRNRKRPGLARNQRPQCGTTIEQMTRRPGEQGGLSSERVSDLTVRRSPALRFAVRRRPRRSLRRRRVPRLPPSLVFLRPFVPSSLRPFVPRLSPSLVFLRPTANILQPGTWNLKLETRNSLSPF